MDPEPPPFGIPNTIGSSCWFQSTTQCLFRNPELRDRIFALKPEALQIKHDDDVISAFHQLISHFTEVKTCTKSNNEPFLRLLKYRTGKPLITGPNPPGQDCVYALEGYFALFSGLFGDRESDFHSFATPLGGLQSLRLSRARPTDPYQLTLQFCLLLDDAPDIRTAILPHLEHLFFLPRFLIVRRASPGNEGMTYPEPVINVPEPFDYLMAHRDPAKCVTTVWYELWAMVCYQGTGSDHAVALVKLTDNKTWWWFSDENVEEKGDDRVIRKSDTPLLSPKFVWPAMLFYRKL
jgi:hypothetical protein